MESKGEQMEGTACRGSKSRMLGGAQAEEGEGFLSKDYKLGA